MKIGTRQKAINHLESIQLECLISRFGLDYTKQFENLLTQSDDNSIFDSYLKSNPLKTASEIEELKKYFEASIQSNILMTRYEVPASYSILKTLYDRIETTANKISLVTKTKPLIGTAQSKEYNAFAVKVPDTEEYLIVFEGELFTLANLLAKIIASCLPDFKVSKEKVSFNLNKDRIVNHIQTNPYLQERFADFVYNAVFLGQPNKTKQYFLDETFGRLQYELLNSLELFVVGHEYGHIYSGHLNENNLIKRVIDKKEIEKINLNWQMEFEADNIGLTLLLHSLDNDSFFPFSYLGAELFFTFLDITERANNLHDTGKEHRSNGCDTHPPTFERRDRIRKALKNSFPQDHLETYEYASKFLEDVLETLWENYKKR